MLQAKAKKKKPGPSKAPSEPARDNTRREPSERERRQWREHEHWP